MGSFDRFPRLFQSVTELEPPAQDALRSVAASDAFDLLIRFPPFLDRVKTQNPFAWFHPPRPAPSTTQLWGWQGDRIFITQSPPHSPAVETIPLAKLLTFELGVILLHAWIEVVYDATNQARRVHVDFNAVGLEWIDPLIQTLRRAGMQGTAPPSAAAPPEELIAPLSYKWQNIVRSWRVPGDVLSALIHEPSIAPGWFGRRGREGHILALATQHLLWLREPLDGYPYGYVTLACLRSQIHRARVLAANESAALELTFGSHDYVLLWEMGQALTPALQTTADTLNAACASQVLLVRGT
jgi:hypothetical protein